MVRRATPSDAPAVIALAIQARGQFRAGAEAGGFLVNIHSPRAYAELSGTAPLFYLAEADDQPVGYCLGFAADSTESLPVAGMNDRLAQLKKDYSPTPVIYFDQMYVEHYWRRQGIANCLYRAIIEAAGLDPPFVLAGDIMDAPISNSASMNFHLRWNWLKVRALAPSPQGYLFSEWSGVFNG